MLSAHFHLKCPRLVVYRLQWLQIAFDSSRIIINGTNGPLGPQLISYRMGPAPLLIRRHVPVLFPPILMLYEYLLIWFNYPSLSLSLRNQYSTLLLFYCFYQINMDPSSTFIGTMAEMMSCQSAPLSAIDPLFDSSTVDFGQSRVAEEVNQLDGIQGIDEGQLESRKPTKKATDMESISSQPRMIRPQHQHNTTDQVASLWPPSCANLPYKSDFPTGSPGSKPTQGNAMFRWMTTIKSKVNAIATILKSTPEETDHLLQRLTNESKTCQNPPIIQGTVRSPNSSDPSLKVGSPTM